MNTPVLERTAFVAEQYRPGVSLELLRRSCERIREAAAALGREGKPVACLGVTIVPGDESSIAVFDAASAELVQEVYELAGEQLDRVAEAITVPAGG